MELKGKVAIVTGSGGEGCGRGIALRLAREGCTVVVSDINEPGAARTLQMIQAENGNAVVHNADVRSEAQVHGLIDFAVDRLGGLDILVNDASAPFRPGDPVDNLFAAIDVDLLGAMYATQAAVRAMRLRGGGAIVNISSTSAIGHSLDASDAPGYDIAKAGVLRLTTTLGRLAATDNIRVNCLAPDWVAVPEVKEYWDALKPEQRTGRIPQVLTTIEEVAQFVVDLITDDTLAGRVLVAWSGKQPFLLAADD